MTPAITPTNADLLRAGWRESWWGCHKLAVFWEWRVNHNLTRTKCLERWDSLVRDRLIFYRSGDGWMLTLEGERLLKGGGQK